MIRNRNAIQLLCLLCLLVYPAINANLEAQTIIGTTERQRQPFP